jgi:ABC-type lipoprotein release transport system permease subunit
VIDGVSTAEVASNLAKELGEHAESFGLHWIRAKTDGLRASAGTTPFDALFLGFSMFIIATALMLVSLLLRLSLEQRATLVGLLAALGFGWKRNLRALLMENAAIVLLGSIVGVGLGVGYAWLMLAGLRTWWLAAVVTPFMELAINPRTLSLGGVLGVATSLITILLTLRRLRKVSASRLLTGKTDDEDLGYMDSRTRGWLGYLPLGLLALAVCLDLIAPRLPTEPQAGAFFGAGACVLAAILLLISSRLRAASTASPDGLDLSLKSLASRNLTRNPTRSTLTIGLVASACFLIVAISAFRLAPTESGTGGFELVGQSDQPIFADLRDPTELEARFNADLSDVNVFALRLQDGDDASCRNLYQSTRPRLIGITAAFRQGVETVGQMEWAGIDEKLSQGQPWEVLAGGLEDEPDVIPVVLDKNTAMYSMHLYKGIGEEFERDYGPAGTLRFRVVGLLAGSIFQGSLLIPDAALLKHFPRVSGFRYFLVDCPDNGDEIAGRLEEEFSPEGLDLTDTQRLLTELLAVQNTYLSTFQSLGGLGLLLGTFGLAAVQLRNVMQRRGELALLRATGYRNDQLSLLVLWEHVLLLLGGLLVGIVSALVVVFPHILYGGASIPVLSLALTLGLVALVGVASALVAQRYLSSTPLLPALRGD